MFSAWSYGSVKQLSNRPIIRLLAFDHCRTLAPWCALRRGETATLQVRRIAHELEQRGQRCPSVLEASLAQGLYLVLSFRQVLIAWRESGSGVRRHYGIGIIRQLYDLLKVTWHANLPPRVYYFQRLFRHANPASYLDVIDHRELQLLLKALHAGVDISPLEDKTVFHSLCLKQGLPTPPILAAYANGQWVVSPGYEDAWKQDLFCKPAISYSSRGVACWRYEPATDMHTNGETHLDRSALRAWLIAQAGENCYIVQPRMRNSADLAPISTFALANCRVVTARREDGSLTVLLAALRMGLGKAVTSDDPDTSFCTAIDPETGVLNIAEAKQANRGSFTHHPDSGEVITGRKLSHWAEMRALALRAHAALPQMIFVGWDVVDTEEGPMLLEGNVVWGGNLAQMAGNLPLGVTGFSEIYLHYYLHHKNRSLESLAETARLRG